MCAVTLRPDLEHQEWQVQKLYDGMPTLQEMPVANATVASFPGRFGRENFREYKLYTDITSRKLHNSFKQ